MVYELRANDIQNTLDINEEWLKIYPFLAFAACRKNLSGAWRAWTIARWIDKQGRGAVTRKDLVRILKRLGVSRFNCSRWLSSALYCGFFQENRGIFYLAGLGKAAQKVSAHTVGLPALVDPQALVSRGWKARIWSAYLSTQTYQTYQSTRDHSKSTHYQILSQRTKEIITGIKSRTQRNFQRSEKLTRRGNYSLTKLRPDQVPGMIENERGVYFATRAGRVLRRLPDAVIVPRHVAKPAAKGPQTQKSQAILNCLHNADQANESHPRLFCETIKQLEATHRKIAHDDSLDRPREYFSWVHKGSKNWFWEPVYVR